MNRISALVGDDGNAVCVELAGILPDWSCLRHRPDCSSHVALSFCGFRRRWGSEGQDKWLARIAIPIRGLASPVRNPNLLELKALTKVSELMS